MFNNEILKSGKTNIVHLKKNTCKMKAIIVFLTFFAFSIAAMCQHTVNPQAKEHVYYGIKLEQKEDWEGALEEYTKALQIDNEYAEAYFYRGLLLINHGEEELKPYGCSDLEMAKHYGYTPASSYHYSLCFQ
mgnify:CR=1 FL=1|jgi:tetratricopeptide (TPR) repeat protein